jgi:uncharacterized RDD family membrane protein YckC
MNSEVAILSPEKVVLTYRLASVGNRILAHLLDLLIAGVIVFGEFLLYIWFASNGLSVLASVIQPLFIPTFFLYFILLEGFWNGLTPGKRAMGLRVRMLDGTPVTPLAALGRNLLRMADFLPGFYFVGILCMVTTRRSQRFGDLAAGTCVFYEKRMIPTFQTAPHLAGLHPFEANVGELKGMTMEEYVTLRRLCDRFPELSQSAQTNLLKEVWEPISRRLSVPLVPNVHPIYLAEAVVMKYGRDHQLL